jgi:hypothetical protein
MFSYQHARLMFVTLSAARLERTLLPVCDALPEWLASWSGIGVRP